MIVLNDRRLAFEIAAETLESFAFNFNLRIADRELFTCNSCYDKFGEIENVSCGHFYCLKCLSETCKSGLIDRSLIPNRCCKIEFLKEYIKKVLSIKEYEIYDSFLVLIFINWERTGHDKYWFIGF